MKRRSGPPAKTFRFRLRHRPQAEKWFEGTTRLFNQAAAFYFAVLQAHPSILGLSANAQLFRSIRALDDNTAHRVSRRIVEFAQTHEAPIIVFEHLGHFQPQKGRYSARGNEKRTYWLRGRIVRYTRHKA